MTTNVRAAIYGVITVSLLLAAERVRGGTFVDTELALALAMLINWLAHGYAEYASRRLRDSERLTLLGLGRSMVHELPILGGAMLPMLTVLICWAVHANLTTAIDAALWTTVATIIGIELVAGVRAELGARELALQLLVGTALGLLVLAVKLALA